jgi:cbb3-type cytochrome oxidase maturation protein
VTVILLLLGASLLLAGAFLVAFIWAMRSGQYDDTYTPSLRLLVDDENRPANDMGKQRYGARDLSVR